MSVRIRKEEYTPLGDFVLTSFSRDLGVISGRFIKLNAAYRTLFEAKLAECKALDSVLLLTEEQKVATKNLYDEADALNDELTFLNSFIGDAGLNKGLVTDLKKDIDTHNIEGAVFKIEGVRQYVVANAAALVAEGMVADYADTLAAHGVSLAAKNKTQTDLMKNKGTLSAANIVTYDELYAFIVKVCEKGKLVFRNTVVEKEYSITWNISKMRGGKK